MWRINYLVGEEGDTDETCCCWFCSSGGKANALCSFFVRFGIVWFTWKIQFGKNKNTHKMVEGLTYFLGFKNCALTQLHLMDLNLPKLFCTWNNKVVGSNFGYDPNWWRQVNRDGCRWRTVAMEAAICKPANWQFGIKEWFEWRH